MDIFQNLDLLSVGIATAGTGVMGFAVYFSDRSNITNKIFFLFSLITVFWGSVNYLSYQFSDPNIVLWSFRFVMFFATLQAFALYLLFRVFPESKYEFSPRLKLILLPVVLITAILCLTPAVFSSIQGSIVSGEVAHLQEGPGIILFALLNVGLVLRSFFILLRKTISAQGQTRIAFLTVLVGVISMFALIIYFNFISAAFLNNPQYVPLGALFVLPFILLTSYSILKFRLFNVKVAATGILVFALSIVTLVEVILADSFPLVIFRTSVFTLVLIFGMLLIKGMISLEKANEQKSEFMSFASHQIRTPVTVMKGYAANILEGDAGPITPELKDSVQKILVAGNNVVALIGDYLDKSKVELGQLKYNFKPTDLRDLVQKVVEQMRPNIEQAKLTINFEVEENKNYVANVDPGKITQVVGNLIDNAIKYTPSGSISVNVTNSGGKIRIKISDTGVGMESATINDLFQKFARAKDASQTNILGTGLGLYLAKLMIDGHKGRIWAESAGKGKGSQFYIEFPSSE